MGQKVHPTGIRLGITEEHRSNWFAKSREYAKQLNVDLEVRKYLSKKLVGAAVSKIKIERPAKNARVIVYSARPGVIIGKKGDDVDDLKREIAKMMKVPVHLKIEEVRKPEIDAKLVAESVAQQLERRVMFRRAMKRAMQAALKQGAEGIKIKVSGRLAGAEIARSEWAREGRVPLHTFRADIDYGTAEANTTYGVIGVKVWIYKGEVVQQRKSEAAGKPATEEEKE